MPLLFSYGTLQYEQVQLDTFGRLLVGTEEVLHGYKLEQVRIRDAEVLQSSGQDYHPILIKSVNPEDQVSGKLFEITDDELAKADTYEVDDYKKVEVQFYSGKTGWVCVEK